MDGVSFGIKTTQVNTGYDDLVRVWREADEVPVLADAWLWDHLVPIFGPPTTPAFEGWTLLTALAAQTSRIRLGHLVTSNRFRAPSVLAKMAATLDVISGGRLILGLGVGATDAHGEGQEFAVREHAAYGLPLVPPAEGRAALAEACTIIRRLWTEDLFDFDGDHYTLRGAVCEPKPVQRPGPPVLLGAWGPRSLRVVAEHADVWNVPGPPHFDLGLLRERSALLDERCKEIGRDPAEIVRSTQVIVEYDQVAQAQAVVGELIEAGFGHIVLSVRPPFPDGVAHWLADEIIAPVIR
ncbi:LLM class flavin-dependent oxidoreductase [Jiangella alkaliphila]|uniref:Luciferase-like monooxygenase n=1 Tax=Jiangella alkaliphila TaxID=419479 RepID=A0A1H2FYG9_9ACTN|nr:LLM class flavin-dependent oxidoreductase [Jiangella alkaliphila]SDU12339.1 Luciferase-like monooxygenase [Jiangella alkaliphila]